MLIQTKRKEFLRLIRKYLKGKATNEEVEFLEKYYAYFEKEPGITDRLPEDAKASIRKEMIAAIRKKTETETKIIPLYRKTWIRNTAAAILLLLAGAGFYYITDYLKGEKNINYPVAQIDLLPGGNKAILTLGDSSTIVLDDARQGMLTRQANSQVIKPDEGKLAYQAAKGSASLPVYNTISTPRGGQYQVTLADGTIAFLNAASSVRFPVSFSGKERKVEITGEVYFEVAKNAEMPFRVAAGEMVVEALGTQFNVMSYKDENSLETTLIEGSVSVTQGSRQTIITPGQQVQIDRNGEIKVFDQVDIEEVVAWKNGRFEFNSASLDDIMRQISRWYNVDVVFEGDVKNETFSGIVSRQSNVSQILKIMEQAGIKFSVEENKITVMQ
jgi:transmembrane sensor